MSGLQPGYLNRTMMLWGANYPLMPIPGFFAAGTMLVALATLITTRQDS